MSKLFSLKVKNLQTKTPALSGYPRNSLIWSKLWGNMSAWKISIMYETWQVRFLLFVLNWKYTGVSFSSTRWLGPLETKYQKYLKGFIRNNSWYLGNKDIVHYFYLWLLWPWKCIDQRTDTLSWQITRKSKHMQKISNSWWKTHFLVKCFLHLRYKNNCS